MNKKRESFKSFCDFTKCWKQKSNTRAGFSTSSKYSGRFKITEKARFGNKRASEKYYILMSLILGLIVLGISLYFIFNEYFTKKDTDWQLCKESVEIRGLNIEENGGFSGKLAKSAMESFPFNCKTEVINIDYEDQQKALDEIAKSLGSCYYLYGEGKLPLYASEWVSPKVHYCFICYRIHFDEEVKDYYNNLNVGEYILKKKMKGDQTYFDYLYLQRAREILGPNSEDYQDYLQSTRERVLSKSTFNSKDGDIIVMNYFTAENENWFYKLFFRTRGWSSGVTFFQPEKENLLNECAVIETIPA